MSQREQNIAITILVILLPVVSFLAGYFVNDYVAFLSVNQQAPAVVNTAAAEESDLGLFWEAWGLIENNFIGQTPSDQQLSYAVIRGALSSLDDPYTIFLEPVVRQEEQISLRGNFGGIGAYIQRNDENQVILLPIPGNPAELAGILEGDVLLAIDGEPVTDEMTSEEIAEKVRGEKGTTVTLTVIHVGETEAVDIEVERGDILVPSVIARMMPDQPTLGYIQLSRFSGESAGEIETAVLSLQEEGAQSIILDLRGNGGGLLDAAVDIADQFVGEGVLLYQESVRDGERVYNATTEMVAGELPLVILVDRGTASAAEILAGALQDLDRATLIGTTTFGKGSVQLVYDLSDGSSIHVTSARWYTPNRNQIDQLGLTPDIVIEPTAEGQASGRDEILERAVDFLLNEQ